MAKKAKTSAGREAGRSDLLQLAATIRESAQQIWLAGLGAFSRAQDEGGKVFETLVREGRNIQRRTRSRTDERMGHVGERLGKAAGSWSKQATQSWDRLEQAFEDRVSRTLARLGVPTHHDLSELVERIDALGEAIESMKRSGARRAARKTTAAKAPKARTAAPARAAPRAGKAAARATRRRSTGKSTPGERE